MKMITRVLALGTIAATTLACGVAQAAVVVPDGSFEAPVTGSYVYNPTVSGVAFNAGSGVQRNGSAFGFANAPDGVQTGFLQSSNTAIGQIVFSLADLVVGQTYSVGFSAAARPNYANNAFSVAFNGATLGSYNVASTAWQSFFTNSFVANATTASLSFTGSATTNGDNDVGLDAVNVAAVPETATWGMMIAGFGMMGAAMRYRRRSANVTFA
jgi:hypothetical protein